MGHDDHDYYDTDYDEHMAEPRTSSGGRAFVILGYVILGCCLLMTIAAFLTPMVLENQAKSQKQKCASHLRGINQAMILYANDNRFFPHMTSWAKENNEKQVSDVYRTLIQQVYCDNAELFVCPGSDDRYIEPSQRILENPETWNWKRKPHTAKPACLDSSRLDVMKNSELSYTYRGRRLNRKSARSDTMITADKAQKGDYENEGCHYDGYNIGYADGHVEFVKESDERLIERARQYLILRH